MGGIFVKVLLGCESPASLDAVTWKRVVSFVLSGNVAVVTVLAVVVTTPNDPVPSACQTRYPVTFVSDGGFQSKVIVAAFSVDRTQRNERTKIQSHAERQANGKAVRLALVPWQPKELNGVIIDHSEQRFRVFFIVWREKVGIHRVKSLQTKSTRRIAAKMPVMMPATSKTPWRGNLDSSSRRCWLIGFIVLKVSRSSLLNSTRCFTGEF